MSDTITLSASQIKTWLECREKWRLKKIKRLEPVKPAIHLVFGQAVHWGVRCFWRGETYEDSYKGAAHMLEMADQTHLNPVERQKFEAMWDYLPDMLAVYFEHHEQRRPEMVEQQWVVTEFLPGINLTGIIDWYDKRVLSDLKTASEVNPKTWKRDYKESSLRDFALGLYDWYLCRVGLVPREIQVEVLIKPYKDKPTRIETIPLNEVIYYRERFQQQLGLVAREIAHYARNYPEMKPYPMSSTACVTQHGACDYLPVCNWGLDNERVSRLYHIKEAA